MELSFTAEYWIKVCMYLAEVICPYNYCSRSYDPSQTMLDSFHSSDNSSFSKWK
jgi:hypothetical protein